MVRGNLSEPTSLRPSHCGAKSAALGAAMALLSTLGLAAPASSADWPGYRGPDATGRSAETGLATTWGEAGPKQLWRVPLGEGYSGISIADGRVYTLFAKGKDEYLVCLNRNNGEELWRLRTDANRFDQFGNGPRSTPLVSGGTVYALSALGKLYSVDAASGAIRWRKDLVAEHGAEVPTWGVSVSPLLSEDLLFFSTGAGGGRSLIALEAATGKLVWATGNEKPGYSTPLEVTVGGARQIVFFTGGAVVGVDRKTGRQLWRSEWPVSYDVNAAMPILLPPDRVFVSSGYGKGSMVFRVRGSEGGGAAIDEIWRGRSMKNQFSSSILVGDHLYGFDDGTFKAISAATGEEAWKKRGFAKGSLLYADGHFFVLSERGLLAVVEATPEGFKETARAQIFQSKTWTSPALSDGILFLRDEKELVALDLRSAS